jgi:two-component system sensor kinase FixL
MSEAPAQRAGTEPTAAPSAEGASQRLQQLIETCQDAVIFINGRGSILRINPAGCRMFGYAVEELTGRNVNMLMAEPYAGHHDGYLQRYEKTHEPRAIGRIRRVSAKRKSGEEFPIELSVTELAAKASDEVRYGAFIRDVSDKVRMQSDLVDRERLAAVGTTASMLVHEIGNPLNNMALQLQVLRRKLAKLDGLEAEALQTVDACSLEIDRLSRLVQEFRALSGRRKIVRRETVVADLVESVLTNYLRQSAVVTVERRFEDANASVFADPDKVQQVILNLCQNAIEAMPDGGQLTLVTRVTEHEFLLEVHDTGPGIPEGIVVFEPFITTKPNGTGLGLAICQDIARDHGGTLTYESGPQGTVFRLALPMSSLPAGSPWLADRPPRLAEAEKPQGTTEN